MRFQQPLKNILRAIRSLCTAHQTCAIKDKGQCNLRHHSFHCIHPSGHRNIANRQDKPSPTIHHTRFPARRCPAHHKLSHTALVQYALDHLCRCLEHHTECLPGWRMEDSRSRAFARRYQDSRKREYTSLVDRRQHIRSRPGNSEDLGYHRSVVRQRAVRLVHQSSSPWMGHQSMCMAHIAIGRMTAYLKLGYRAATLALTL